MPAIDVSLRKISIEVLSQVQSDGIWSIRGVKLSEQTTDIAVLTGYRDLNIIDLSDCRGVQDVSALAVCDVGGK
jgi:hypothetical protein